MSRHCSGNTPRASSGYHVPALSQTEDLFTAHRRDPGRRPSRVRPDLGPEDSGRRQRSTTSPARDCGEVLRCGVR